MAIGNQYKRFLNYSHLKISFLEPIFKIKGKLMKTIFINGNIFTVTHGFLEAMVIEDEKFIYVGNNLVALTYQHGNYKIVDLEDCFVTAGFNDSHMHVLNYGNTLQMAMLTNHTSSIQEVKRYLKHYINQKQVSEGQWIKARGWNHDYFEDEKRFLNRYDLDEVSLTHPIIATRACGHVAVCNSKAIELLKLEGLHSIEGGEIERDENGILTGVFKENAIELIKLPLPNVEQIKTMLLTACQSLNSYGITSAQTDDFSTFENYQDIIKAYQELEQENRLTVKIYEQVYLPTKQAIDEFLSLGFNTGSGTEMFRIGPLKLLTDGSLGARTAHLSMPYEDDLMTSGIPIYTLDQLKEIVSYANQKDMQIAIHAIGDQAIENVINAYDYALKVCPKVEHRHGIVHVQITRKDLLEKIRKLKLYTYIQSIFLDYDINIVHSRLGKRANDTYAFKTLFETGHASNGSDAPVELPDVLKGIQCAITRKSINGKEQFILSESLNREEAIVSFTLKGAYASFEENIKGSIEVGKKADFVVLDQSPFYVHASQIKDIQVLKTYINGKLVYSKK